MFFRSRSKPRPRFRLPDAKRIYAIGDIHGRLDLLEQLLSTIANDDAARPKMDMSIVFLGDLLNRGPDSQGVVSIVRALCGYGKAVLVKGNHEEIFVNAARNDRGAVRALLAMGGEATLRSYGIDDETIQAGSFADLAALLIERIPRADVDFLDAAPAFVRFGDFLFTHAGIEPGVAIGDQNEQDMRWIRERFTRSDRDHGLIVVHGHTITDSIDVQANRIGLDTGAYASGRLSAIGIEGGEYWFLEATATREGVA